MPVAALRGYLERLPELRAELFLLLADAASLPYAEDEQRARILERWLPEEILAAKPATPAVLAMMGIGYERQPG